MVVVSLFLARQIYWIRIGWMRQRLYIPLVMALIAWTGGAILYGLSVVTDTSNIATLDAAADLAKSKTMFELLANLLVGGGVGTIIVVWSVLFMPLVLLVILARPRKQSQARTPDYTV